MTTADSDWTNQIPTIDFSDPTIRHDRILVVEDVKFFVRADMLSLHSEYFDTMFNSTFKEANEKEIKIEEVKPEDFRTFLNVIYMVDYEITGDNYRSLIDLACRFLAHGVLHVGRKFIFQNFDTLDKIDLLELASKYNLNDVKEKTAKSIASEKANMYYQCIECDLGFNRCNRNHGCLLQPFGFIVNKNSYVSKNFDRFSALPLDIQGFVFQTIVKENKRSL